MRMNWRCSVYNSIESIVLISGVVNGSDWAVGFNQAVRSLNDIAVASFVLWFNVSGMIVIDSVFVSVFWMSLVIITKVKNKLQIG